MWWRRVFSYEELIVTPEKRRKKKQSDNAHAAVLPVGLLHLAMQLVPWCSQNSHRVSSPGNEQNGFVMTAKKPTRSVH